MRYLFTLPVILSSASRYLHAGVQAQKPNDFKHNVGSNMAVPTAAYIPPITHTYTATKDCVYLNPEYPPILTLIYPSLGAQPIEITSQSQVVTSYIPDHTWCVGAPLGLVPVQTVAAGVLEDEIVYSMSEAGTGQCETVYATTETTVCATTLTGLASKIFVSKCNQQVTFSSDYGFTLEMPTPTTANLSMTTPPPIVKRMLTYWVAPWQSLTAGETPSDVDIKVCTILENGHLECTQYHDIWEVFVVTQIFTTLSTVDIVTTISGPGELVVATEQITHLSTYETISLSSMLLIGTETMTESTSKKLKLVMKGGRPQR